VKLERLLDRLFQRSDPSAPSRVGLALSGGGARGIAHIGVLKVLEREGIQVDYLAGTSMGGLIAAGYAAGLGPDLLQQEALRMTKIRHLVSLIDVGLGNRGLLMGQKALDYLNTMLGSKAFADLEIPLTLTAVDLNSGREVRLNQGLVAEAVRATIALPGVIAPVERDGQLLVDGGVLNSLPANIVREMGADIVIAVDVSPDDRVTAPLVEASRRHLLLPKGPADTIDVMWRSLAVAKAELGRRRLTEARPDVIIKPQIPPQVSGLTGFNKSAELIALGETATQEAVTAVHQNIAQFLD
jgi:NTE family protein